jgi:hypothetical protein
MRTLDEIKTQALRLGFLVEDPMTFGTPGCYQGIQISLYVATGRSMSSGYDFAGFDQDGSLVAVGRESGGPGAFSSGGWLWIKGRFGYSIPSTKLDELWL